MCVFVFGILCLMFDQGSDLESEIWQFFAVVVLLLVLVGMGRSKLMSCYTALRSQGPFNPYIF